MNALWKRKCFHGARRGFQTIFILTEPSRKCIPWKWGRNASMGFHSLSFTSIHRSEIHFSEIYFHGSERSYPWKQLSICEPMTSMDQLPWKSLSVPWKWPHSHGLIFTEVTKSIFTSMKINVHFYGSEYWPRWKCVWLPPWEWRLNSMEVHGSQVLTSMEVNGYVKYCRRPFLLLKGPHHEKPRIYCCCWDLSCFCHVPAYSCASVTYAGEYIDDTASTAAWSPRSWRPSSY